MALMASLLASTHFFSFSLISAASNKLVKTTSSCPWRKNLGKAPRAKEKPFLQKENTLRWNQLMYTVYWVLYWCVCFPDDVTVPGSLKVILQLLCILPDHPLCNTQTTLRSFSCRSNNSNLSTFYTLALFSFSVTRVSNWKYLQKLYFLTWDYLYM